MPPRVLTRASSTAVLILALVLSMLSGCAPAMRSTAAGPLTAAQMAELWVNPGHLSDRQLEDGFRAAGKTRARFVRKLKSKIAEGLALREEGER